MGQYMYRQNAGAPKDEAQRVTLVCLGFVDKTKERRNYWWKSVQTGLAGRTGVEKKSREHGTFRRLRLFPMVEPQKDR